MNGTFTSRLGHGLVKVRCHQGTAWAWRHPMAMQQEPIGGIYGPLVGCGRAIFLEYPWVSTKTGWWFGTWILWLSIQLGISSSQLTFIFFRGVETTNQTNYGQEYSVAPFWGPEIPTGNSRPPDGVACGGPADLWDWKKTKAQRSADTFPVRVRG